MAHFCFILIKNLCVKKSARKLKILIFKCETTKLTPQQKKTRRPASRPTSEATGVGQVAATHEIEAGQLEGEATRANRRAQREANQISKPC